MLAPTFPPHCCPAVNLCYRTRRNLAVETVMTLPELEPFLLPQWTRDDYFTAASLCCVNKALAKAYAPHGGCVTGVVIDIARRGKEPYPVTLLAFWVLNVETEQRRVVHLSPENKRAFFRSPHSTHVAECLRLGGFPLHIAAPNNTTDVIMARFVLLFGYNSQHKVKKIYPHLTVFDGSVDVRPIDSEKDPSYRGTRILDIHAHAAVKREHAGKFFLKYYLPPCRHLATQYATVYLSHTLEDERFVKNFMDSVSSDDNPRWTRVKAAEDLSDTLTDRFAYQNLHLNGLCTCRHFSPFPPCSTSGTSNRSDLDPSSDMCALAKPMRYRRRRQPQPRGAAWAELAEDQDDEDTGTEGKHKRKNTCNNKKKTL
jgi:hypothetical protein